MDLSAILPQFSHGEGDTIPRQGVSKSEAFDQTLRGVSRVERERRVGSIGPDSSLQAAKVWAMPTRPNISGGLTI